jgi:nucleoid-associated protein YgaU
MVVVFLGTGCGVKAKTYVMTKDREDIQPSSSNADYATGNAGYISGTPKYIEPERKTRKVYILELTKHIAEGDVKKIEQETTRTTATTVDIVAPSEPVTSMGSSNKIVIPAIEDEIQAPVQESGSVVIKGPSEDTVYTVSKDDTLQKIAKKFYGSYGQWLKIYNANKEKIKNPNFLKPGTVITIPAAK